MPADHSLISIGRSYSAFDSFLIGRGFVPIEMGDKWFIYLERNRLLMRRSWTGFLIYDVEAQWRGDELYLGQAAVNRDRKQYGCSDDAHDREMMLYLIGRLLLRLDPELPQLRDEPDAPKTA